MSVLNAKMITGLLLLAAVTFSCGENGENNVASVFSNDKFDAEAFASGLKNALKTIHVDTGKGKIAVVSDQLKTAYIQNAYNPLWLEANGAVNKSEAFLEDLERIKLDGIDPERYQLNTLKKRLSEYKSGTPAIDEIIALDTSFTASYLQASRDLLLGMLVPRSVDSLWFHANDTAWKITHIVGLLKDNKYPSLDSFRSNWQVYAILKNGLQHYNSLLGNDSLLRLKSQIRSEKPENNIVEAIIALETPWLGVISDTLTGTAARVQAFQQYCGIRRTGKIDSITKSYLQRSPGDVINVIAANMERLRWLPRDPEKEYVMVNIPSMDFYITKEGSKIMSMLVVVGKPSRQTPALNAQMANIVINPPWGVPPTILKKDVLPGVLKSGSGYLRKKGLEAFDHKGRRIDASTINASNYKRYTFRQPPGHSNALGYVKFNFPNKWDIYMHDTPHREDFEKFDRAKSSGCIRLQHPQELATYILSDIEGRNYGQDRLDSVIATGKTKWETLKTKIPVHIVYFTAWEDETGAHIRFPRDFYGRDARLMAAISR